MIIEKGLEQWFWAFFQFFDHLGNRAATPIQLMISPRKGIHTGRRKFICM